MNTIRIVKVVTMTICTILLTSCGPTLRDQLPPPGTTITTLKEAEEVAKTIYHLVEIEEIEQRHLQPEELKQLPNGARNETPIYYVIKGKSDKGANVTVIVSSNNLEQNFKLGK